MKEQRSEYKWFFQRMGGLDQVIFRNGEDICRLQELDPKLWVALSSPASGLEFDQRTLDVIDTDDDNRVRVPEVIEAVNWVCARLKEPDDLLKMSETLHFYAIDESTDTGRKLLETARAVLKNIGKEGTEYLTQEDVTRSINRDTHEIYNGDGIIPPLEAIDEEVRHFVKDALCVVGGVKDASGEFGINQALADAFIQDLKNWNHWQEKISKASQPLGKDTPEAWQLLTELKNKIDDYFLRADFIAYAPRSEPVINVDDKLQAPEDHGLLEKEALAELPLALAEADKPLNLCTGINPAWKDQTDRFAVLIKPYLENGSDLTKQKWQSLQNDFSAYKEALTFKPEPVALETVPPQAPEISLDKLGKDRIVEILNSDVAGKFKRLAYIDSNTPAAAADIDDLEKMVLYHKHLYRLLINFVSFQEFYATRNKAAFQAGTLFIDGRACHLCMPAENVEEHTKLASLSYLYLLYCQCKRGARKETGEPEKEMNIVAAVTIGDSDLLLVGRNGIYIDNLDQDWDATVIKIVSNPIGVTQALWSPYKKLGKTISEQVDKISGEKQDQFIQTATQQLSQLPQNTTAPTVDIGRNVGIFAALGLAFGAIGTALASIARALFALSWWQVPLVFLAIFAVISGPSVVIAWLKLRKRTLGPLLEASGWAINGRARIRYSMAARLTSEAELPVNAKRGISDPYAHTSSPYKKVFIAALLAGVLLAGGLLFLKSKDMFPFHRNAPQTETAPQTPDNASAVPDNTSR